VKITVFRSTLRQSRPNKAGLKCLSVRPFVRAYVRPSTKSLFDFEEIWHVGRGRRVIHDSMQYDPIQGQGQALQSRKFSNFQKLSPPPFTMGASN